MGVMERLSTAFKGYFNAGIDSIENIEFSLEERVRQMEDAYAKTESAVAGAIAQRVMLERNMKLLGTEVTKWSDRLVKATTAGNAELTALAETQLQHYEELQSQAINSLNAHTTKAEELKLQLAQTKMAIQKAKSTKNLAVAQYKGVKAQEAVLRCNFLTSESPVFSEFTRLTDKIVTMQAKVDGMSEVRSDPYEKKFAAL